MCFSSVYQEVDQGIPLSLHIFLHFSSFSSSILVTSSDIALNTYALFCICLIMVQGIMLYANVIQKILLKEWGSGQQPTLAAEPQCLSPLSMGKQCPHFWKKSIAVLNSQKKKKKKTNTITAWMSITTSSLIFVNGLYISATGSYNGKGKYTLSSIISEPGNAIQVRGLISLPMIFTVVLPWLWGSTNYRYFQDLSELFQPDSLQGDLTVSQSLNHSKLR